MATPETSGDFPGFVSLACHDMRTPLATVSGFVRTLPRLVEVDERGARYLEMMDAACGQLGELLDDLGLVARIEGGRYDPLVREADTLELARAAADQLAADSVQVGGRGGPVAVEPRATARALFHLARCALRHGGLPRVELEADGPKVTLAPVAPEVAPILVAADLRDLGAAVAMRTIAALGGSASLDAGSLVVRLPLEPTVS